MGILGNEAADVFGKKRCGGSVSGRPREVAGGGIRQWAKQRRRRYLEEREDAVIGRAMGTRYQITAD